MHCLGFGSHTFHTHTLWLQINNPESSVDEKRETFDFFSHSLIIWLLLVLVPEHLDSTGPRLTRRVPADQPFWIVLVIVGLRAKSASDRGCLELHRVFLKQQQAASRDEPAFKIKGHFELQGAYRIKTNQTSCKQKDIMLWLILSVSFSLKTKHTHTHTDAACCAVMTWEFDYCVHKVNTQRDKADFNLSPGLNLDQCVCRPTYRRWNTVSAEPMETSAANYIMVYCNSLSSFWFTCIFNLEAVNIIV